MDTDQQYDDVVATAEKIFESKTKDYGTSWTVLRPISIVDQLYIKAKRIRTIQETGVQKVADDVSGEFQGLINYGAIGLIQLQRGSGPEEIAPAEASKKYHDALQSARETMLAKNHDYGEAWRDMTLEGLTDLILMKLLRIRQILANDGKTLISEGIDAGYIDIINYAAFALIKTTGV